MTNEWISIAIDDLAVLRFQGADATRFLQGQLSNDVAQLGPQRSLLAGLHNPQGRTVALLRLLWTGADEILGLVPRELAAPVVTRLSKFVLRSKVKISDASKDWRVTGLIAPPTVYDALLGGVILPTHPNTQSVHSTTVITCVGNTPSRWFVVAPTTAAVDRFLEIPGGALGDRETWRRHDVEAGQPQVYAATSEEFVAQMLNLDVTDAISFAKGCYTGQEVIARAHYRGRVKRRLQRFVTSGTLQLHPGDMGQLPDGRTFKVVEAVQLDDGRCEFLAVAPMLAGGASAAGDPSTANAAGVTSGSTADGADSPVVADISALSVVPGSSEYTAIECEQLALPYALPA